MKKEILIADNIDNIYDEINALIREKKTNVKKVVNDAIISLNWGIGKIYSGNGIGFCIFSKTETFGTGWQEELCNFQGCFD